MKFSKWFLFSLIGMFIIMGCSLDETSPNILPLISSVIVLPDSIGTSVPVGISAVITDVDGTIEDVILQYGESITDSMKSMISGNDNLYTVEIGPFVNNITINYEIKAIDDDGEISNYSSSFTIGEAQPQNPILFINELLASNDTTNEDEFGGFDDWFELYNGTEASIDIGGMYVSDDLTDLTKWQIPNTEPMLTTIQPGAFLLIWADSETAQGVLHVDFNLSSSGEDLAITDVDGVTIIDFHTFGVQTTDVSKGRSPDGGATWQFFTVPTPDGPN